MTKPPSQIAYTQNRIFESKAFALFHPAPQHLPLESHKVQGYTPKFQNNDDPQHVGLHYMYCGYGGSPATNGA